MLSATGQLPEGEQRMAKATTNKTADSAPAETDATSRPIQKFDGSGGLHVAIWKHPSENGPAHYSTRLDRSFRKDGGDIESTPYLRDGDLLRAQKLLEQADAWIEQDKAKYRSRGAQEPNTGR
jgi:hypothetical protein